MIETSWPGPGDTHIRVARAGDSAAFARLVELTGVAVEEELASSIEASTAADLLLPAFESGNHELLRTAAAEVAIQDELVPFFARVSLPLVAVDSQDGVVGALQAIVPGNVITQLLSQGWPLSTVSLLAIRATKVAAVATDPHAVRKGVATALLHSCCHIYFSVGYRLVYGFFRRSDPRYLERFYRTAGFELPRRTVRIELKDREVSLGAAGNQLMFALTPASWARVHRLP